MNLYGKETFSVEQIDIAKDRNELNRKERYWINHYDSFNNGYNMPCTLRDPHWFPGYNGFGVNSNKFNCPKEYQSDVRVFDNYVESYFPAKD